MISENLHLNSDNIKSLSKKEMKKLRKTRAEKLRKKL